MNAIIGVLATKLIAALTPLLLQVFAKLGQEIVEKIAALLPVIVAAGTKAFTEQLARKLPDLPSLDLPDLPRLAEQIRAEASAVLPHDVDIPVISDIGEKVFGFDLTDTLSGIFKPR